MSDQLRRSPLYERHVALGAKFAEFGGWEMPLEYAGGGVLKEHTAVREAVGIFDVSHLGKATVRGSGARAFVNACLTNDLIAYLHADDHVFLIPNAANTAEVVRRLQAAAPTGITITNEHEAYA